jgi:hypothetical protein
MSVSHTTQAVIERRKTVTRRLGWKFLKPGDRLTLCRKVQGRRRRDGTVEPLERLAEVEIANIAIMPLDLSFISYPGDIEREGVSVEEWDRYRYDPWAPLDLAWIKWFAATMGCEPATQITRIEWRYLDASDAES